MNWWFSLNWSLQAIQQLVQDKQPEVAQIDFKRSEALDFDIDGERRKDEFAKDVSSFANAGGGTLIYGVAEAPGGFADSLDLGLDATRMTRDRLYQVLRARVRPPVPRVHVTQILLASGRCIFAIDVPQTESGPHQAPDFIYYERVGTITTKMADYRVRDVMRRSSSPDLFVDLIFATASGQILIPNPDGDSLGGGMFAANVRNESQTQAELSVVRMLVDVRLVLDLSPFTLSKETTVLTNSLDGRTFTCRQYSNSLISPSSLPIFHGITFSLITPRQIVFPNYRKGGDLLNRLAG